MAQANRIPSNPAMNANKARAAALLLAMATKVSANG